MDAEAQQAFIELFKKMQESLSAPRRSHDDIALPIYDPVRADSGVATWCSEIEQLGSEFKWNSREMVARAGKVLRGGARSWFDNWEPEHRDWETFKAAIVDLFPPKRNLAEKLKNAVMLTSDTFASYCEYAREKIVLFNRTKIRFSEDELVELVIGEIKEVHVRMGALNSNLKTTSELIALLSGYSKISRKRSLELEHAAPSTNSTTF